MSTPEKQIEALSLALTRTKTKLRELESRHMNLVDIVARRAYKEKGMELMLEDIQDEVQQLWTKLEQRKVDDMQYELRQLRLNLDYLVADCRAK